MFTETSFDILLLPQLLKSACNKSFMESQQIFTSPLLLSYVVPWLHPEGSSFNSAICNEISKFCVRFYNAVLEIYFEA